MEKLISDGDSKVHDLAHDGLDSVWACQEREIVAGYFGSKTREIWKRICSEEHGR
jgi:hypothetical protein